MNEEKNNLVSFMNNDENDEEHEDDEDDNEKPLINKKPKTKKKSVNMRKGYCELSNEEKKNMNELFETSSKIVNALDYEDEDEEDDDDDENFKEDTEQTKLTKSFKKKNKKNRNDPFKKSLKKKLFSKKKSLEEQSSFEDDLNLGKIKILIPKKKNKSRLLKYKLRKCTKSFFFLFLVLFSVITILILFYIKRKSVNQFVQDQLNKASFSVKRTLDDEHCHTLTSNNIWNLTLPKISIEGSFKLLDINKDGELDILIPFGTSIDQLNYNSILCKAFFDQKEDYSVCGGGVLALDGKTGIELWRTYTKHKVKSIQCDIDITLDGINDCFATGILAVFYALDSQNGKILWNIDPTYSFNIIDKQASFHNSLVVPKDLNGDGLNDILTIHGGIYQKSEKFSAKIILLSSKDGSILIDSIVPDKADSLMPLILNYQVKNMDSNLVDLVYGTGNYNEGGSLWSINLNEFLETKTLKKSLELHKDCCNGIIVPPILIDLNDDKILDFILPTLNSSIIAYNGKTYEELWIFEIPNAKFFVQPTIGYFNDDNIPDLFIQYEIISNFPLSIYSEIQVLNGKNGKKLLKNSIKSLTGSYASPITISLSDKKASNLNGDSFDFFVFWKSSCDNENKDLKNFISLNKTELNYNFNLKYNSFEDLKKVNFCKLRFNSLNTLKLTSLSYPNLLSTIHDSIEQEEKELNNFKKINYTKILNDYLDQNPDYSNLNNLDSENNFDKNDQNLFDEIFSEDKRKNNYFSKNDFIETNDNFKKKQSEFPLFNYQDYSVKTDTNNAQNSFNLLNYQNSFNIPNDQNSFNLPNIQNRLNIPNNIPNSLNFPYNIPNSNYLNNLNENSNLNNFLKELEKKQKNMPQFDSVNFDFKKNNFIDNHLDSLKFKIRKTRSVSSDHNELILKAYSSPTLIPSNIENSIDIVFTSNWIEESQSIQLISKDNFKMCVDSLLSKNPEVVKNFNHKNLIDFFNYHCGKIKTDEIKKNKFDLLLKKKMGFATIHRNNLVCKNKKTYIKNYESQIWPNYMGLYSSSIIIN